MQLPLQTRQSGRQAGKGSTDALKSFPVEVLLYRRSFGGKSFSSSSRSWAVFLELAHYLQPAAPRPSSSSVGAVPTHTLHAAPIGGQCLQVSLSTLQKRALALPIFISRSHENRPTPATVRVGFASPSSSSSSSSWVWFRLFGLEIGPGLAAAAVIFCPWPRKAAPARQRAKPVLWVVGG